MNFSFQQLWGETGINTAINTAVTGYIQRRLVKAMETCKTEWTVALEMQMVLSYSFYMVKMVLMASLWNLIQQNYLNLIKNILPSYMIGAVKKKWNTYKIKKYNEKANVRIISSFF